jgi:hypothetical protein
MEETRKHLEKVICKIEHFTRQYEEFLEKGGNRASEFTFKSLKNEQN